MIIIILFSSILILNSLLIRRSTMSQQPGSLDREDLKEKFTEEDRSKAAGGCWCHPFDLKIFVFSSLKAPEKLIVWKTSFKFVGFFKMPIFRGLVCS